MISKPTDVQQDQVRTLYKFMSYPVDGAAPAENAERRRRAEALLREGELYFATARELNDPFEAAPHFQMPDMGKDDTIGVFSRALRDVYAPRWRWNEEQILAAEATLREEIRSGKYETRIAALEITWKDKFRSDYPMCCLAGTRDSTLMWSYYATGHTGICVHLDATKAPFANADRVIYSERYPAFPLPVAYLEAAELHAMALLTKSKVWSHENEYRVINMPMAMGRPNRVLDDIFKWQTSQLAVIPTTIIIGVTLGAAMRDTEIETILRICHDRSIRIPAFQAKCAKNRFNLEFASIR